MKKTIIRFLIFIGVISIIGGGIYLLLSTYDVTIKLTNVSAATIKDSRDWTIKTINSSNQTVRLFKGGEYTINYTADAGFESGVKRFTADSSEVTVSPYYSSDRLSTLLTSSQSVIRTAATTAYPSLPKLYDFNNERLYHFGDWYSATLVYKGSDVFNADTLRLVLHKTDDTWHIATAPPMPSLNSYNSGENGGDIDDSDSATAHNHSITPIPYDILQRVNSD